MEEKWKIIKTEYGQSLPYEISNFGNVKRIGHDEYLKHMFTMAGYHQVMLRYSAIDYNKRVLVHRLVAQYFIPNPNCFPQVNHKDGNKDNNRFDNLEWCTASYNNKHAYMLNLNKPMRGEDNIRSKYTERQIRDVCKLLEEGTLTNVEISKITGVIPNMISCIRLERNWRHISKEYTFGKNKNICFKTIYQKVDRMIMKGLKNKSISKYLVNEMGLEKELSKTIVKKRRNRIRGLLDNGSVFVFIDD